LQKAAPPSRAGGRHCATAGRSPAAAQTDSAERSTRGKPTRSVRHGAVRKVLSGLRAWLGACSAVARTHVSVCVRTRAGYLHGAPPIPRTSLRARRSDHVARPSPVPTQLVSAQHTARQAVTGVSCHKRAAFRASVRYRTRVHELRVGTTSAPSGWLASRSAGNSADASLCACRSSSSCCGPNRTARGAAKAKRLHKRGTGDFGSTGMPAELRATQPGVPSSSR
jgi:hypothetical protein